MPTEEVDRFEMVAPGRWLKAVVHWRAKQDDIPSRDEAIRGLVEHSLDLASESRGQRARMDVWDADVARGWMWQTRG
ncbi:MAG: hypothetical protein ABI853_01220 [Sphingomicrobium sp.]